MDKGVPPPCRSPALSDDNMDTQPHAAAAAAADKTKLKKLKRCNAKAFLDDEAEVSGEDSGDEDEEGEDSSMQDFIVPDDQVIAIDSSEDECPPSGRDKRSLPDADERMLLDEEIVEQTQAQPPAEKRATTGEQRRAEPAPEPPAPAAAAAEAPKDSEDPGEDVDNKNSRYARWCFTWFPGDSAYRPSALPEGCSFLCFQEEICPHTGKLHLQGYIRFEVRRRYNQVLGILQENMPNTRLRKAKKCELACIRYCTKTKSRRAGAVPVELGKREEEAGRQGRRTDLAELSREVMNGKTYDQLADSNPEQIVLHSKGFKELIAIQMAKKWSKKVRDDITVTVLFGETGTGKTHRVRMAEPSLYVANPGRDSFGNYEYEPAVLFEEFGMGGDWDINLMKKLLDKWPAQLDCRYANKWAAWSRVYIISQDPPHTWYMMAPAPDKRAFWRRVTQVQQILLREDDPKFVLERDCKTVDKPDC